MADIYWRKYGVAPIIYRPLQTRDLMDWKAAPTLAAGDVQVSIDDGAWTAIEGAGTFSDYVVVDPAAGIQVKIMPSVAQLTAKILAIKFVDQTATKEWEDDYFTIETYGHPSAQHPYDFSIPNKGFTNVIRANTAQAGSTTSTLVLDSSASAVDDFYNGRLVFITGGTGANQMALITDYTGSSKTAIIRCLSDTGLWITTPDATSTFSIFDRDPQFAASIWKAPTSVYTDAGSFALLLEQNLGAVDTGFNVLQSLKEILAKCSGDITKTGDAYAYKDKAGNLKFTLTITGDNVVRS